jgi:hypothetical protein
MSAQRRTNVPWTEWWRRAHSRLRRCNTCWNCNAIGPVTETYDLTLDIARQFGGAYGLGVIYARAMVGKGPND